jgi:hypothetical protein
MYETFKQSSRSVLILGLGHAQYLLQGFDIGHVEMLHGAGLFG